LIPHSVEFDVLDHFSIYFLHDPLDFVFTLAENSAKIENFLIFLRSRRKRKRNRKKINVKKKETKFEGSILQNFAALKCK
jgi:hypothetical protein